MFPRPLYVSVRYLENASFGPCACRVWLWLFCVVSRHGMSEEEAPASAYLRAVPKCVAGFVYTERPRTLSTGSIDITAHTHAQMHTHYGRHVRRVCGVVMAMELTVSRTYMYPSQILPHT